jgi:hypothetical protein
MRYIWGTIEKEGFEYTFVDYSDFDEVDDKEFHDLRKAYLEARSKFAKFLGVGDDN